MATYKLLDWIAEGLERNVIKKTALKRLKKVITQTASLHHDAEIYDLNYAITIDPHMINWRVLSLNRYAIFFFKNNIQYIDWNNLSLKFVAYMVLVPESGHLQLIVS